MSEKRKVAIMQPYFLPYIGYWQLINAVDVFVVYDDIQFTKKGWINRNRYLMNGTDNVFSIPLKKASDYLNVVDRELSDTANDDLAKQLRKIESAYKKAPYFSEVIPLIKECFTYDEKNLFHYIYHSILTITRALDITTEIVVSSSLGVSTDLRGQERVIETCKRLQATDYINPIGGKTLYDPADFSVKGIKLHFQNVEPYIYPQFADDFLPHLSILDVLMFNGVEQAKRMLTKMKFE